MATEVVVVVVQTRCNDEMFIHDAARDAPNYGGRVPVDTTTALYLCTGPLKITPSAHRRHELINLATSQQL